MTAEEARAVAALKRLARKWPASLWLFSASGSLHVMRKDAAGNKVHDPIVKDAFDASCAIAAIDIENDGGDW